MVRGVAYVVVATPHVVGCAKHAQSLRLEDLAPRALDPGDVLAASSDLCEVTDGDADLERFCEPLLGIVETTHVHVCFAKAVRQPGEGGA